MLRVATVATRRRHRCRRRRGRRRRRRIATLTRSAPLARLLVVARARVVAVVVWQSRRRSARTQNCAGALERRRARALAYEQWRSFSRFFFVCPLLAARLARRGGGHRANDPKPARSSPGTNCRRRAVCAPPTPLRNARRRRRLVIESEHCRRRRHVGARARGIFYASGLRRSRTRPPTRDAAVVAITALLKCFCNRRSSHLHASRRRRSLRSCQCRRHRRRHRRRCRHRRYRRSPPCAVCTLLVARIASSRQRPLIGATHRPSALLVQNCASLLCRQTNEQTRARAWILPARLGATSEDIANLSRDALDLSPPPRVAVLRATRVLAS